MNLSVEHLDCGYGKHVVLRDVKLRLESGQFVCLLGPNGSGKTALIKTLAGVIPKIRGAVAIEGRAWERHSSAERARLLAYVPQAHAPVFAFSVRDVVVMGRTAQWPLWSGPSDADWAAADEALAVVQMEGFADRLYTEISGGERQMTLIARAIAQKARFIFLDEPASSLDLGNQVRVLQLLQRLVASGLGVLMASHNPDHALRYASLVSLVHGGRLHEPIEPKKAVTAGALERLYQVPFLVSDITDTHNRSIPVCVPAID
jgi:iron complex transport system ATP-binding protein